MLKFEEDIWPPTPESTSFDTIGQIAIDRAVEAEGWKELEANRAAGTDRRPITDSVREEYISDIVDLGLNVGSLLVSSFGLEKAIVIHESLAEGIASERIREIFWMGFGVRASIGREEAKPAGANSYLVASLNKELGKYELTPRPPVSHEIVLRDN